MRTIFLSILTFAASFAQVSIAQASQDIADQYPQSELYSKPVEVIPHVWSAIGATAPPTYENSGHNNNLSFIVTDEGVVVVNSGASSRLAAALLPGTPSARVTGAWVAAGAVLAAELAAAVSPHREWDRSARGA